MKVEGKALKTDKKIRQKKGTSAQILWNWGREKDTEKNEEEQKNYERVAKVFGVEKPHDFGSPSLLKARIEAFCLIVVQSGKPISVEL